MIVVLIIFQVKSKLKGHQKRITGLAFSNSLNVLVSSGADFQVHIRWSINLIQLENIIGFLLCHITFSTSYVIAIFWCLLIFFFLNYYWWQCTVLQLCVWSTDGWDTLASKFLQIPSGCVPSPLGETRVQFHQDQKHFLAVHETQIAIYEASKLECIKQVQFKHLASVSQSCWKSTSWHVWISFNFHFVRFWDIKAADSSMSLLFDHLVPKNKNLNF